jgi:hypothetical protein
MCPACGEKPLKIGHVMCFRCWKLVPMDLQAAVYAAWAARQENPDDESAVQEHERAKDAAIQASIARRR